MKNKNGENKREKSESKKVVFKLNADASDVVYSNAMSALCIQINTIYLEYLS